uniref:Phospholipase A2 n=1 Tax=Astyanax mexicanus TaxID=7994 RepID=A0A8B9JX76_ASTMX
MSTSFSELVSLILLFIGICLSKMNIVVLFYNLRTIFLPNSICFLFLILYRQNWSPTGISLSKCCEGNSTIPMITVRPSHTLTCLASLKSDLYVTLHLPTASTRTLRTKCVPNSNTPEWNDNFHFRVPSQVKNILELNIYDQDILKDDLCTSILFDISNLTLGEKETKVFITDDKVRMCLTLELSLLVTFLFNGGGGDDDCDVLWRSEKDLSVRLDFDIPEAEKAFLKKRKVVASSALQKALNLSAAPDPSKVPTVAVVLSGGGTRAMTASLGSLRGLQKLGLLDTVSYITAVSGSTWALSSLYSDPRWSAKGMDEALLPLQKELSKNMYTLFSPSLLQYYKKELEQREKGGHPVTLIDMWGLALEQLIFGKKYAGTLSDQQRTVSEGQNPLPIYTAVNMKEDATGSMVADTHPDAFPNSLTPGDPRLGLVDSGFDINSGFAPVLRSHRHVNIILSLNYSWEADQFRVLKQTQQYCADRHLAFPRIDFNKVASEPEREVYVFEDEDNPEAPIIIHFPLRNVSFKQYKAPGVKRQGEKELKEGDVNVTTSSSPYATQNLTYAPKDFQRLIDLTSYNIVNNRDTITRVLQRVLHRTAPEVQPAIPTLSASPINPTNQNNPTTPNNQSGPTNPTNPATPASSVWSRVVAGAKSLF